MSSASYKIVNLDLLSFLFSLICCETCGQELDVTDDRRVGLATFSFCCGSCGNNVSKSTSLAASVRKSQEINRVYAKLQNLLKKQYKHFLLVWICQNQ